MDDVVLVDDVDRGEHLLPREANHIYVQRLVCLLHVPEIGLQIRFSAFH